MAKNQETYTEVAIRLKSGLNGKFNYITYREDGSRNPTSTGKLTVETAKKQLNLYTRSAEATVVTREVEKTFTDWEEVEISEVKLLAEILHKKQCHWNHIDQCDWDYSPVNSTHKEYEAKAQSMLEVQPFENIKKLLELM